MTLSVQAFPGGSLETNTYLVADDIARVAIVVDAADATTQAIVDALADQGLTALSIVLTHTHWDHIVDAAGMRRTLGVPLLANSFAQSLFGSADGPISAPDLPEIESFVPDGKLDEADEVTVGAHRFTVLFLPGHERAHIGLWSEADNVLVSGDVLFPGGHGTTEIKGSDQLVMNQTIRRLGRLPGETVVYPGHGDPTTIGAELHWIQALKS
jgi:glyoxylase-like metal-dependent hydrolase (beta-lactamase superfamily II)